MPRSSSNDDWRRYRVACLSELIWLFRINDAYDFYLPTDRGWY
ncbi:MAG TPA: hypothetical protein V6C71_05125 [Coleofasciculaceae cyanobacterium]